MDPYERVYLISLHSNTFPRKVILACVGKLWSRCVWVSPLTEQMGWEPPDLPEEAVCRVSSWENRQFLKWSFQVSAINLSSAFREHTDWRASLLLFIKCVMLCISEVSETKQPPAALCKELSQRGEAVGHQYVNKLPHSINQAGKVGQWSCRPCINEQSLRSVCRHKYTGE